jgi:hypothetical protein
MEINSIQNSYHTINSTNLSRDKKAAEDSAATTNETYGADTVEISSGGNFKAELGTYSKTYETQSKQSAAKERIDQLKTAYAGDNCPASSVDIASAIMKYALGSNGKD